MSAGDVKFVGWTGTDPLYRELEPTFTYQPASTGFALSGLARLSSVNTEDILVKLTRRFICFAKDKDKLIGSIGFSNVSNTVIYIDTDGSVKTKNVGVGWQLQTIDEAVIAKGYVQIAVSYVKTENKAIAFLLAGIRITCENGVCKIQYAGTAIAKDLETIDSGTGVCTTGLKIDVVNYRPSPLTPYQPNPKYANIRPGYIQNKVDNPEQYQDIIYSEAVITCNDVEVDRVQVFGRELEQRQYKHLEKVDVDSSLSNEEILAEFRAAFVDDEYTNYAFRVLQSVTYTPPGSRPTLTKQVEITRTYKLPVNVAPFVRWERENNLINLTLSGTGCPKIIMRQYDVTGLD